jgi:hypothetical protein
LAVIVIQHAKSIRIASARVSDLDIDASEDARCAGEILMLAVGQTGLSVEQWLVRVQSADPLC